MPARGPSPPRRGPAFDDTAIGASGLRAKAAWVAESAAERDRLLGLPPASRLAALDDDGVRALLTAEHRAEVRASLAPAAAGRRHQEDVEMAWSVERRRLAALHVARPVAAIGCGLAAMAPFAGAAVRFRWGPGDAFAAFLAPGWPIAGVVLAAAAAGVLARLAGRTGSMEALVGLVLVGFAAGVAGLAVAL